MEIEYYRSGCYTDAGTIVVAVDERSTVALRVAARGFDSCTEQIFVGPTTSCFGLAVCVCEFKCKLNRNNVGITPLTWIRYPRKRSYS